MNDRTKKIIIGIVAFVVLVLLAGEAFATPDPKVFVCKYVGTPGEDERLQTGQNPISVSVNSIKDYQGVGSYFNDKHGRSYVLAEDNGQPEPDVSECPIQEGKPNPDEPDPVKPPLVKTPEVPVQTESTNLK